MQPDPQTQNPAGGRGSELKHALVKAQANGNAAAVHTSIPPSPDRLLSRLNQVRKAGAGWSARCPAHEDRTASLSIAFGNDGRLLAHCHAGCSVHDVLGIVGLTINDLFPQRLKDSDPEARRELQGLALKARLQACANVLGHESGVVLIAAGDLSRGCALNDADQERLAIACERIHAASAAIGGRK